MRSTRINNPRPKRAVQNPTVRLGILLVAALMAFACSKSQDKAKAVSPTAYKVKAKEKTVEKIAEGDSKAHTIDRVIKSMFGPSSTQRVALGSTTAEELVWLRGAHAEIIDAKNGKVESPEYLCHAHIKYNNRVLSHRERNKLFGGTTHQNSKLIHLVQGGTSIDLPEGFGMPVLTYEPLQFHAMVISNNPVAEAKELKVRSRFDFVRDEDLKEPLLPLARTGISLKVPVFGENNEPEQAKKALAAHKNAALKPASSGECALPEHDEKTVGVTRIEGKKGEDAFSYHWLVPPGKQVYRYQDPKGLNVPFDTTVHYLHVHLHAYAESLEIRDVTANKTLFTSRATNYKDRIGIKSLTHFSSKEGIKVYKDHKYELIATYNNTTDRPVDAMAIAYLFYHDKTFDKAKVQTKAPPEVAKKIASAPVSNASSSPAK